MVALKRNKLFIGYSALIFTMCLAMTPLFLTVLLDFGELSRLNLVFKILPPMIAGTILMETIPFGILLYLWLQKGGGSDCLRRWNMGRELRVVGSLFFSGFILAATLSLIDAFTIWNFSHSSNLVYLSLLWTACGLILGGTIAFIGLWIIHSAREATKYHPLGNFLKLVIH